MAQIKKIIDSDRDLTTLVFSGKVAPEEVIGALKEFYGASPTLNTIWNFSDCDLSAARMEQLSSILVVARSYAHLRKGGRSALVLPGDVGFGLGRMYEAMAEGKDHPVEHAVFRSVAEALKWLDSAAGRALERITI